MIEWYNRSSFAGDRIKVGIGSFTVTQPGEFVLFAQVKPDGLGHPQTRSCSAAYETSSLVLHANSFGSRMTESIGLTCANRTNSRLRDGKAPLFNFDTASGKKIDYTNSDHLLLQTARDIFQQIVRSQNADPIAGYSFYPLIRGQLPDQAL